MSTDKDADEFSARAGVPDLADIAAFEPDWTIEEEKKAKRK